MELQEASAQTVQKGLELAESWSNMPREKLEHFGYGNYPEEKIDFLEGITDDYKRSFLATLFENYRKLYENPTTTANVSTFPKYIFPLIRAVYANIITADIFSVQPLPGPTGLIFYFDVIYGSTKGSTNRGDKMFNALSGPQTGNTDYSSEKITGEFLVTSTGTAGPYSGNLSYLPVRPGSVQISDGTLMVTDDGAGNLTGDVAVVSGGYTNTIDYNSGAYSFKFASTSSSGDSIIADYDYDMENSDTTPEVEILITSAPVTTQRRRLKARWSTDAEQDLQAVHGIAAEAEIVGFLGNEIQKEKYNYMINQAKTVAPGGYTEWDSTTPLAVAEMDHRISLLPRFTAASNKIFTATQRFGADWAVVGPNMATYIEALPAMYFTPEPIKTGAGVHKIGTLSTGQIVYKDPTYASSEAILGHKGTSFLDAGIVEAVYVGLYSTDVIRLDDFRARVGLASRTAIKVVNSRYYSKLRIN